MKILIVSSLETYADLLIKGAALLVLDEDKQRIRILHYKYSDSFFVCLLKYCRRSLSVHFAGGETISS